MACFASDKAFAIDQTPSSGPSHGRVSDSIGLPSTSACFCRQVHVFEDEDSRDEVFVGFINGDVPATFSELVGTRISRFDPAIA